MCSISGKCAPACVSALPCTDGALLMCRWYAVQQGKVPFAQQLVCACAELGEVMTTPVRSHCLPYQAVRPIQPTGQLSHSHCVAVLQSLLCDRKLVKLHTFLTAEDTNLQATEMEPSRIDRLPLASGEDVRCWSMIHRTSVCGSVRVTSLC